MKRGETLPGALVYKKLYFFIMKGRIVPDFSDILLLWCQFSTLIKSSSLRPCANFCKGFNQRSHYLAQSQTPTMQVPIQHDGTSCSDLSVSLQLQSCSGLSRTFTTNTPRTNPKTASVQFVFNNCNCNLKRNTSTFFHYYLVQLNLLKAIQKRFNKVYY